MPEIGPPVAIIFVVLTGIALAIALVVFWCRKFIELMLLRDADFPGRFDKTLWFVAFVLMFFLAPVVFDVWKDTHLGVRSVKKHSKDNW